MFRCCVIVALAAAGCGGGTSSTGSSDTSGTESVGSSEGEVGEESESSSDTGEDCEPPPLGEVGERTIWVSEFDEGFFAPFYDLAVLSSGDIVGVGGALIDSDWDFVIARWSSVGELLNWEVIEHDAAYDQLTAIEALPTGGYVVAGGGGAGPAYFAEFDAADAVVAADDFEVGEWTSTQPLAMALGPGGVPYVLGGSFNNVGRDTAVEHWLMAMPAQTQVWGEPAATYQWAAELLIDPDSGDYIVGGTFIGSPPAERWVKLLARNLDGTELWTREFATVPFGLSSWLSGMAFDASGDVVIAASESEPNAGIFQPLWARVSRETGEALWDDPPQYCLESSAQAIAVVDGRTYVLFLVEHPSGEFGNSILALDDAGKVEWAEALLTPNYTVFTMMEPGPDGSLYVLGMTAHSVLLRFDP